MKFIVSIGIVARRSVARELVNEDLFPLITS